MYQPMELARFALSEFERGLEGLTDEEARTRIKKSDGTEMNAISWAVSHIAAHWLLVAGSATREALPDDPAATYGRTKDDPTPPALADALKLFENAKGSIEWIDNADDALLSTTRADARHNESVGTALLRVVLHTWFHTGEINAVRQLLGHPEMAFVGKMLGHLEWRGGQGGTEQGYRPDELARFAVSEFERGLEGLTDEEARTRTTKADGSEMNAISWTMGHIAGLWLALSAYATDGSPPFDLIRFVAPFADPTPPPLGELREQLDRAKEAMGWLVGIDDELLANSREGHILRHFGVAGTALMNGVLHTWFHTGEINAVRQLLGHAEIGFVGPMLGQLEWRSKAGR